MNYENERKIQELKNENYALEQKISSGEASRSMEANSKMVASAMAAHTAAVDGAVCKMQSNLREKINTGIRFELNTDNAPKMLIPLNRDIAAECVKLIDKLKNGELEEQDVPMWIEQKS